MKQQLLVALALSMITIACTTGPDLNLTAAQDQATPAATPSATSANCPSTYPVAYRIMRFNGVKAAVWYPSAAPETDFAYSKDISSSLAKDGQPLTDCGTFPLVIFSHGLFGCGDQSIFFTETLARYGYVVVAPDHKDALLCSVDGNGTLGNFSSANDSPIMKPETWTDTSYQDRRDSIESVLNGVLQDSLLQPLIDTQKIGIAGHSLGGYTALAMVGGWASWKDNRFKAVLAMSPYSLPFSIQNTLKDITVPVMYQGAAFDIGITPFVDGPNGAYAQSNTPKYFVKLRGGNHFTWTNAVCAGTKTVANCLDSKPATKLIDDYGIAFFDLYLKGQTSSLLTTDNILLNKYEHQP